MRRLSYFRRIGIAGTVVCATFIGVLVVSRAQTVSENPDHQDCNINRNLKQRSDDPILDKETILEFLVSKPPEWMRSLTKNWSSIYLSSSINICRLFVKNGAMNGIISTHEDTFPISFISPTPPEWRETHGTWRGTETNKSYEVFFKYLIPNNLRSGNGALVASMDAAPRKSIRYELPLYDALDRASLPLCKFVPEGLVIRNLSKGEGEFLITGLGCPVAYFGRYSEGIVVVEFKAGLVRASLRDLIASEGNR